MLLSSSWVQYNKLDGDCQPVIILHWLLTSTIKEDYTSIIICLEHELPGA